MFNKLINIDNDNSLNKIASKIIYENSIRWELRKFKFDKIEFVDYFPAKDYYALQNSEQIQKMLLLSNKDLIKSDLDTVFEYRISIRGDIYKLFIISPNEFFHASYVYEMFRSDE